MTVFVNYVHGKEGDKCEGLTLHDFKIVWRVSWSFTWNILVVSNANNNGAMWKEAIAREWAHVTIRQ
jgi:hypothetical protein